MAVQFKVPKSPSRDIAATDTFMGVDLTNTGANIDGIRSPHAPNMVRLVPGKVRKRMGYYKEVLFGTKTNVNFAKDTSAKEREIIITPEETSGFIKIYDYIQELPESATNYYIEFDYTAEHDFMIVSEFNVVEAAQPDEEGNYPHYSGIAHSTYEDGVYLWSEVPQEIYIKNFSLMLAKDTSYEWSPAPKHFVERESNDPVYGVHYLRNGKDSFEGDRITNVNRVLETSDEWKEFQSSVGNREFNIAKTKDLPGVGTKVYIDFDYRCDAQVTLTFDCVYPYTHEVTLASTNMNTTHYSEVLDIELGALPGDFISRKIDLEFAENGQNFHIKNLTIVYAKDAHYAWSPAPEDNDEKFHQDDMFVLYPKNYATETEFVDVSGTISSSYQQTFYFCTDSQNAGHGKTKLSFDITATTEDDKLEFLLIGADNVRNASVVRTECGVKMDEEPEKYHVEFFTSGLDEGQYPYIGAIFIKYYVTGSTKATTKISNICVQKYVNRDSYYVSPKSYLYHVGSDFYLKKQGIDLFEKAYDKANEHISKAFQINNMCYIIDGKELYQYALGGGGAAIEIIDQDNAYIPMVTEAKEPKGGGQPLEALNLLQPGFEETFLGDGTKTFQLSFNGLDDTRVQAWILDSNANWILKREGTDFTVNRTAGKVKFTTAPAASTGEPNVKIRAYRTVDGYRDRITKCTFGTLFGIGGATNRIFLAGNPDHPNWDFYCQMDDPTYFPDIAYSVMGSEQSAIMGYAVISNYLATFKDGFDQSQSVFIREGDMLKLSEEETATSEPVFKLINTLQGEGVAASYSFGYLQTEPVFLTKAGIYAITEQDITGEKYSQNRSFYLDGKLRKEENLENAIATVYDNQYILALNGKLYVLDGLQATRTDKSEPYATRQYAGFLCEGIPATCLWTDDAVCFGTNDGKVCKFYTDVDSLSSYNDDGKAIYSCWETPDLDGKLFYKNKTFRYMAVRLMAAIKTSVKLYSRRFGIWTLNDESAWTFIKSQNAIGTSLDFNNLDFNLFSFSADTTERVIHTKLRVKKVDKARFRVENGELDEPFGIFDLALEYIESGNYKG